MRRSKQTQARVREMHCCTSIARSFLSLARTRRESGRSRVTGRVSNGEVTPFVGDGGPTHPSRESQREQKRGMVIAQQAW